MITLFIIVLIISPFLWLATFLMTSQSKSFKKIFLSHCIVMALYLTFLISYSHIITGQDPYGLGQMMLLILAIVLHIVIGFIHGLYVRKKMRQSGGYKTATIDTENLH
jgi:Na+-transporting NADH:ubiquinone oxidoreductase subunit NqrD